MGIPLNTRNGALLLSFIGDAGKGKDAKILGSATPIIAIRLMLRRLLDLSPVTLLLLVLSVSIIGQGNSSVAYNSQEVSETDGIPVLIKHLPDWESVRESTVFARDVGTLKAALGERAVLDAIDFAGGTEAVTANYPAGRLLIVEYTNPESSSEADALFAARSADPNDTSTVYRRIGNYNAFVFDTTDPTAANALLDQVKYEKDIQWLGEDPTLQHRAERFFIVRIWDIFSSTVMVVLIWIGSAIAAGVIGGFLYFRFRERQRSEMSEFSDAGGMTRLNLDGFTPDTLPKRSTGK